MTQLSDQIAEERIQLATEILERLKAKIESGDWEIHEVSFTPLVGKSEEFGRERSFLKSVFILRAKEDA